MSKNMLIDSAHAEEVRVAVVDGEKLYKFDFEIPSKAQIKGNIYLAKIVRVEPSLQAAFVDYGAERHGFLSFSEIHCDYFQIPVNDRQDLETHIQNAITALLAETGESMEDLDPQKISKIRYQFYRRYKIQEVIKKRQVMLVQVTKEERGNKGAALTTYVSLTGRYCIYMPNMSKGSGVSRKVIGSDRVKIKKIVSTLAMDSGSVVVRTASVGRSKADITKDFNYLKKMWDEIRETTVQSIAPRLIHEEAGIIKRSIRDLYSRDVESIFVDGEEGYKVAKSFIKKLMPSHVKRVKLYEDEKIPLFNKFKINDQINQIYSTRVDLPSGGYLVINTTEALVAVDVNSGKSIRERNIAETALKTNLEAAAELARQCRLRDLGGLIVVDFIDMMDKRANSQVERCLRDSLREDKAKIQVGVISHFGLLEFSRQRLRASIADANTTVCPCCGGMGFVWSDESTAIQILRKLEEALALQESSEATVALSENSAMYLLNRKRLFISGIERRTNSKIIFRIDSSLPVSEFRIEQTAPTAAPKDEDEKEERLEIVKGRWKKVEEPRRDDEPEEKAEANEQSLEKVGAEKQEVLIPFSEQEKVEPKKGRRRPRRRKRAGTTAAEISIEDSSNDSEELVVDIEEERAEEPPLKDNIFAFQKDIAEATAKEVMQSFEELEAVENNASKEGKKDGWWQKLLRKPE